MLYIAHHTIGHNLEASFLYSTFLVVSMIILAVYLKGDSK